MRIQSPQPLKNGGWLHALDANPKPLPPKQPERPAINAGKMMREWRLETSIAQVDALAARLCLSGDALRSIGCAWAERFNAWAFPMFDGYEETVGIRLRAESGKKWAVSGSHSGIFLPAFHKHTQTRVYVCEGPTDTAAVLTMGLVAIGRPSCSGSMAQVITLLRRVHAQEAVIVSDNDDPGLNGAAMLASHLNIRTCIFVPPAKDIREFIKLGGNRELLESMTHSLIWAVPTTKHQEEPTRQELLLNSVRGTLVLSKKVEVKN